jgi:peptide/nickel transport system substrate-binding protein
LVEDGQIQGVVLNRFEDYYGEKPFVEQMIFRYYPDAAVALEAYRQDQVMGISQITADVLPAALKEPALKLYTGRLPQLSLVYLNLDNPEVAAFQDPAVRRALMMGINRQWIIDRLLSGQGIVANGPILPETWAYYDGVERLPYDPDAAIALLKEAGYTVPAEGGDVRSKSEVGDLAFELVYPDEPKYAEIAQKIQQDWARLGARAELKAVPYEELIADHLGSRSYQAALVELNLARSPDPDPYPFWHQSQVSGGQNYANWNDRSASEYLEQARVLVDTTERTRRYRNFQVRYTTEMPALPLFYPVYSYGVDEEVQGVGMGPLFDPSDRFSTVTAWFLESRQAVVPVEPATPAP